MCTKTGIKHVYKGVQGACPWKAGPAVEAWLSISKHCALMADGCLLMNINVCIWVMESVPNKDGDDLKLNFKGKVLE